MKKKLMFLVIGLLAVSVVLYGCPKEETNEGGATAGDKIKTTEPGTTDAAGTAETGTTGSGTAETGTKESGAAGTGTESGTADTGAAKSGTTESGEAAKTDTGS